MAAAVTTFPVGFGHDLDYWGASRVHKLQVTLDASYPAGGYALGLANFGVQNPSKAFVIASQVGPTTGPGVTAMYDGATDKLVVFGGAAAGTANAQITATTNLATVVLNLLVIEAL